MAKKVYAKLEVDFNSKKRERCCKLDIHGPEANLWEDLESKVLDSIRNTLDRRIQFYEDEIRKLNEQRLMPIWNFYNFFILKLLFKPSLPYEVASRGYSFIISFSKELVLHEKILPFCTREIWIITACLGLINATASHYSDGLVAPDIEKEFYRFQGDLYSLCRTKFIRLAYLICYGSAIERSPANSASLSILPWPKPAVWPSVPSDASSEVPEKEKCLTLMDYYASLFFFEISSVQPGEFCRKVNLCEQVVLISQHLRRITVSFASKPLEKLC